MNLTKTSADKKTSLLFVPEPHIIYTPAAFKGNKLSAFP